MSLSRSTVGRISSKVRSCRSTRRDGTIPTIRYWSWPGMGNKPRKLFVTPTRVGRGNEVASCLTGHPFFRREGVLVYQARQADGPDPRACVGKAVAGKAVALLPGGLASTVQSHCHRGLSNGGIGSFHNRELSAKRSRTRSRAAKHAATL